MSALRSGAVWWSRRILPCCVLLLPAIASAQPVAAEQLQRTQRLNELEQLRRDTRLKANADVPPGQRLLIDYGAYFTASYLSVDDASDNNHVLREYEFLPYIRMNFDGAHELFLRGRIGYRDFNAGDSFDGLGDEPIDGDLDRGYYRFDLARYRAAYDGAPSDTQLTVQLGRDFIYWGNGLVLAQVIDGGVLTVGDGRFSLQLVAGVTPPRTVDIDSSRPDFDHNTRRGFYGAMLSADLGDHRPYAYVLAQRDYNTHDFRQVSFIPTQYDYHSNYLGIGSIGSLGGNLRYSVEAAYEWGRNKSNSFSLDGFGISAVDQTTDDIQAWAADARLDYLVNDTRQTRVSGEFILASGDSDRGTTSNTFNGNLPDTDDKAFNAFGLTNTGLAFAPDVSNIVVLRGGIATFPFAEVSSLRRLQVGTDVFVFGKFLRGAPIDEVTGNRYYLGWEPDVYLNWQITSDITLALRYGIFFPSEDNLTSDEPRQLFYAGVTFAF